MISVDDIEMISIVTDGTAATKPKRASANRSPLPLIPNLNPLPILAIINHNVPTRKWIVAITPDVLISIGKSRYSRAARYISILFYFRSPPPFRG